MSIGAWGRKVGMTQIFDGDRVVPVTAINVASWVVTDVRTKDKNGYSAVQVGQIKARYLKVSFSHDWIKKPNQYFAFIREIRLQEDPTEVTIGERSPLYDQLISGDQVNVSGKIRGRGFQGVVKRHDFTGGPASHGDNQGRRPGAMSFFSTQGRVIKGKRLPGHMGNAQRSVQNLKIIRVEPNEAMLFVKGAIPGHSGSLVFVSKRL